MAAKTKKPLTKGNDPMLLGVAGGIADYLGVDSTVIRVLWVIVTAITGFIPGIVAYVIAALVMPSK